MASSSSASSRRPSSHQTRASCSSAYAAPSLNPTDRNTACRVLEGGLRVCFSSLVDEDLAEVEVAERGADRVTAAVEDGARRAEPVDRFVPPTAVCGEEAQIAPGLTLAGEVLELFEDRERLAQPRPDARAPKRELGDVGDHQGLRERLTRADRSRLGDRGLGAPERVRALLLAPTDHRGEGVDTRAHEERVLGVGVAQELGGSRELAQGDGERTGAFARRARFSSSSAVRTSSPRTSWLARL